jgi:hypothetical protein
MQPKKLQGGANVNINWQQCSTVTDIVCAWLGKQCFNKMCLLPLYALLDNDILIVSKSFLSMADVFPIN